MRSLDVAKSQAEFDRALAIDPKYVPARTARGSLYYQTGRPEMALEDLEAAAKLRPDDAAGLDRLGQTYQALDRTADAVRVLRRAAELDPGDSKTLLHLARALADAGETAESKAVMDRFRELGPEKPTAVRGGFVEYLSLSEAERHAHYKARLEKALREHPEDAGFRVNHVKLLLADGEREKAMGEARKLAAAKPGASVLVDAGRALLAARVYGPAAELLRQSGAGQEVAGDLAIATELGRAESLEAEGRSQEALEAIMRTMDAFPNRPDLYCLAVAGMVRAGRAEEASTVADRAVRAMPAMREMLLLQAGAAALAGKSEEAGKALEKIRARWPEWPLVWAVQGAVLYREARYGEARKSLDTAAALGESGPGIREYRAALDAISANGKQTSSIEPAYLLEWITRPGG